MKLITAALVIALTALPGIANAKQPDFPALGGRRVVDEANEIPDKVEADLTAKLNAFQEQTGHEMVIVTIPDLKGYPKDDYAYQIGRFWGIGRKGVDDGIVLLQSPGDGKPGSGKVFIAVGYGLEPIVTDGDTHNVYNQIMLPILKGEQGTPGEGLDKPDRVAPAIVAGTDEVLRIAAIDPRQKAEDDRRVAMQRAKDHQAAMASFWAFLGWVGTFLAMGGTGIGIWRLATRKRRARERAEAEERKRIAAVERAEQRRREEEESARRQAERQRAAEEARQQREQMLAAMTPQARNAFIEQERQREREAQEQAEARRLARKAEEARQRRQREEERAAREAQDERDRVAAAAVATSTWTPSPTPSYEPAPSPTPDYSPGGGSFGGGGGGGDY